MTQLKPLASRFPRFRVVPTAQHRPFQTGNEKSRVAQAGGSTQATAWTPSKAILNGYNRTTGAVEENPLATFVVEIKHIGDAPGDLIE